MTKIKTDYCLNNNVYKIFNDAKIYINTYILTCCCPLFMF